MATMDGLYAAVATPRSAAETRDVYAMVGAAQARLIWVDGVWRLEFGFPDQAPAALDPVLAPLRFEAVDDAVDPRRVAAPWKTRSASTRAAIVAPALAVVPVRGTTPWRRLVDDDASAQLRVEVRA